MTKSTITRERLEELAAGQSGFNLRTATHEESQELARMALATMDSEPVYQYQSGVYNDDNGETDWYWDDCDKGFYEQYAHDRRRILYRHAQPAPVVPDEMTIRDACKFVQDMRLFDDVSVIVMRTWNACRAAMLQEKEKSAGVSNNCRSNEKVQDLQAGTFRENGNSSTNNFREIAETSTNRSREHFISLCNEFWNWSEMDMICADDKGYEPRIEWNGQSFTHPVTRGLWRMYQAANTGIPMNSNGWIPVSERLPEVGEIVLAAMGGAVIVSETECTATGLRFFTSVISGRELPATHWMPLPADPQEVNHG